MSTAGGCSLNNILFAANLPSNTTVQLAGCTSQWACLPAWRWDTLSTGLNFHQNLGIGDIFTEALDTIGTALFEIAGLMWSLLLLIIRAATAVNLLGAGSDLGDIANNTFAAVAKAVESDGILFAIIAVAVLLLLLRALRHGMAGAGLRVFVRTFLLVALIVGMGTAAANDSVGSPAWLADSANKDLDAAGTEIVQVLGNVNTQPGVSTSGTGGVTALITYDNTDGSDQTASVKITWADINGAAATTVTEAAATTVAKTPNYSAPVGPIPANSSGSTCVLSSTFNNDSSTSQTLYSGPADSFTEQNVNTKQDYSAVYSVTCANTSGTQQLVGSVDVSLGADASCAQYIQVLHQDAAVAGGEGTGADSSEYTIPSVASSVWEDSYLVAWTQAQFGNSDAGPAVACHYLDMITGVTPYHQYAIAYQAGWPAVPGGTPAQGGDPIYTTSSGSSEQGGPFGTLYGEPSVTQDTYAWGMCSYNPGTGQWGPPPSHEFDYVSVAEDVSAAGQPGQPPTITGSSSGYDGETWGGTGSPSNGSAKPSSWAAVYCPLWYDKGAGIYFQHLGLPSGTVGGYTLPSTEGGLSNPFALTTGDKISGAVYANPAANTAQDIDYSNAASGFYQDYNGHNYWGMIVAGLLSILIGIIYLWSLGGLALGVVISSLGFAVFIDLLVLILILAAINMGQHRNMVNRAVRVGLSLAAAKAVFMALFGLLLAITNLGDQLGYNTTGGSTMGDSLMQAFIPLIALFLLSTLAKRLLGVPSLLNPMASSRIGYALAGEAGSPGALHSYIGGGIKAMTTGAVGGAVAGAMIGGPGGALAGAGKGVARGAGRHVLQGGRGNQSLSTHYHMERTARRRQQVATDRAEKAKQARADQEAAKAKDEEQTAKDQPPPTPGQAAGGSQPGPGGGQPGPGGGQPGPAGGQPGPGGGQPGPGGSQPGPGGSQPGPAGSQPGPGGSQPAPDQAAVNGGPSRTAPGMASLLDSVGLGAAAAAATAGWQASAGSKPDKNGPKGKLVTAGSGAPNGNVPPGNKPDGNQAVLAPTNGATVVNGTEEIQTNISPTAVSPGTVLGDPAGPALTGTKGTKGTTKNPAGTTAGPADPAGQVGALVGAVPGATPLIRSDQPSGSATPDITSIAGPNQPSDGIMPDGDTPPSVDGELTAEEPGGYKGGAKDSDKPELDGGPAAARDEKPQPSPRQQLSQRWATVGGRLGTLAGASGGFAVMTMTANAMSTGSGHLLAVPVGLAAVAAGSKLGSRVGRRAPQQAIASAQAVAGNISQRAGAARAALMASRPAPGAQPAASLEPAGAALPPPPQDGTITDPGMREEALDQPAVSVAQQTSKPADQAQQWAPSTIAGQRAAAAANGPGLAAGLAASGLGGVAGTGGPGGLSPRPMPGPSGVPPADGDTGQLGPDENPDSLSIWDPAAMPVAPQIEGVIPLEIAQQHRVVGVNLQGDTLVVASDTHLSPETLSLISQHTGYEVRPVWANTGDITGELATTYGPDWATPSTPRPAPGNSQLAATTPVQDQPGPASLQQGSRVTQGLSDPMSRGPASQQLGQSATAPIPPPALPVRPIPEGPAAVGEVPDQAGLIVGAEPVLEMPTGPAAPTTTPITAQQSEDVDVPEMVPALPGTPAPSPASPAPVLTSVPGNSATSTEAPGQPTASTEAPEQPVASTAQPPPDSNTTPGPWPDPAVSRLDQPQVSKFAGRQLGPLSTTNPAPPPPVFQRPLPERQVQQEQPASTSLPAPTGPAQGIPPAPRIVPPAPIATAGPDQDIAQILAEPPAAPALANGPGLAPGMTPPAPVPESRPTPIPAPPRTVMTPNSRPAPTSQDGPALRPAAPAPAAPAAAPQTSLAPEPGPPVPFETDDLRAKARSWSSQQPPSDPGVNRPPALPRRRQAPPASPLSE